MEFESHESSESTEEMNGGCSSSGHPGAPVCVLLEDFLLQFKW